MAVGDFGDVVSSQVVSTDADNSFSRPKIIHATGTIYAISYSQASNGLGAIETVDISNDGSFSSTTISKVTVDGNQNPRNPDIIKVADGMIAAIFVHRDTGSSPFNTVNYRTYSVSSSGTLSLVDSTTTAADDSTVGLWPGIRHVSGDIFFSFFGDEVETIEISSDGTIVGVVDGPDRMFQFSSAVTRGMGDMVRVRGNIAVAIGHGGGDDLGDVKTFTVDDDGTIGTTELDDVQYTSDAISHNLEVVDANNGVIVIGFTQDLPGSDDRIETITIDASGNITEVDNTLISNAGGSRIAITYLGDEARTIMYYVASSPSSLESRTIGASGTIESTVDSVSSSSDSDLLVGEKRPNYQHVDGQVLAMITVNSSDNATITTFNVVNSLGANPSNFIKLETDGYTPLFGGSSLNLVLVLRAHEWKETIQTNAVNLATTEFTNNPLAFNYVRMTIQVKGIAIFAHAAHPVTDGAEHDADAIDLEEAALLFNKDAPTRLARLRLPLVSGERVYNGTIRDLTLVDNPGTPRQDFTLNFEVDWSEDAPAYRGWS